MNTHKMQIASAVQLNGGKSNLNLDRRYLGTAKIGQILPIFHQECVPGDSFRVHIGSFARFLPLAVPSYVNLTYRTLSVFVPYHQVMDGAESFFSNQASFRRQDNTLPTFTLTALLQAFHRGSDPWSIQATESSFDFYSGGAYYKYNAKGWYVVKLLHSLGYRYNNNGNAQNRTFNALPLLAFCHAYNCYMAYSPDVNTSELSNVLETLKRSPNTTITANFLAVLLGSILLTYEESFFSLAWRQPFYSQPQQSPQSVIPDYDQRHFDVFNNVESDIKEGVDWTADSGSHQSDFDKSLNAAQIRLIMKFDDFFRRSNYAGSKDIEQIYSRFGVKIDDFKTRYPYFLNETGQNVKIGDVTSTADTSDTSPVGAYAGKAISSSDASFDFDSHDYGMLFTFAWYAPKLEYYLGCDKEVLRLQPFDFYTPELDEGFPSAVTRRQLDAAALGGAPDSTFGYVPLYSEYLYANSVIVGEFERRTGFDAWHFGRNFQLQSAAQSDSFIYVPCTGTPLERIFNVSDPTLVDVDSIYMDVHVNCSAVRPMKDFVGKTRLGEGNIDVPQLGYQAN